MEDEGCVFVVYNMVCKRADHLVLFGGCGMVGYNATCNSFQVGGTGVKVYALGGRRTGRTG